jgi:hypothetical protein
LPPFLVISNGFHWKETTSGGDWGSTWTNSGNPLFIAVLVAFIVSFGVLLWRLNGRVIAGARATIDRRRARWTAICQAVAFFNLAGLFVFAYDCIYILYMKGLGDGLGRYRVDPPGLTGERYELSNPSVIPSLYIPLALCAIAVFFGAFYLWRAYKVGQADDTGRKQRE